MAEDVANPWSVSVGVGIRNLEANFKSTAPTILDWSSLIPRRSNDGEIGFYQGNEEVVRYGNGAVGMFDFRDGTCTFFADSPSQLGTNPNSVSNRRDPVRTISFRSDIYSYAADVSQPGVNASDDETSAYPYIAIRYKGPGILGGNIGLFSQYSFAQGDFSSGNRISALANIQKTHEQYKITYDIDEYYVWFRDIAANIPLADPAMGLDGVVWDSNYHNQYRGEGSKGPRRSKLTDTENVAAFAAITRSTASVDLHELALAPEWRQQRDSYSWGVILGPTLNVIDADINSMTQWINHNTGHAVASVRQNSKSDQEVKIGVILSFSFSYNIDAAGRYFIEAMGGYHWLDDVAVGSSEDKVSIDASSADVSLGLGVRF
ncbi:MAG: hypothetical protein OEL83_08630 [Desulforhopalus sp.]|nr:hypothetical protein [Desulforhopalus sp.]